MKTTLFGGVAAAAFLAVAPSFAQAPAVAPAPHAAMAPPVNVMKTHTRAEVQARVAEHFARLDSNRDGFLTKAEADAGRDLMRREMRQRFASRLAEPGRAAPRPRPDAGAAFDRLDANKDGVLSRQEFEAGRQNREHRMAARGPGKGARAHMRMHRGGMRAIHGAMFEVADANRDGRVTLQEATAAALRHFDTADVNRDGQLTPDERIQVRQRLRAERRRG